ncbi:hypothetical protein J6590_089774, partial [Homalodisca vitripennis]
CRKRHNFTHMSVCGDELANGEMNNRASHTQNFDHIAEVRRIINHSTTQINWSITQK